MNQVVRMGSAGEPIGDEVPGDDAGRLLVATRTDPDAFGDFYDLVRQPVLAFFYRRTMCPHTSADLAAETFAQALASVGRFDPAKGTGRSWVFGIAGNLYKRWLRTGKVRDRARRRLQIQTPELHEEDLSRIDSLADLVALRAVLADALATLPPDTRTAVVMRVVEQRPYSEIATLLATTEGNARVRVARGLSRLSVEVGIP